MNTINGADLRIVAELQKIRYADGPLPAFCRGQMHFDFDAGKVRIARASS